MSTEIARVEFSSEQVQLIKRTICQGTDDELALFLSQCKRTGLDPFAKQIYAIRRKGKMSIQIGIDGFRLIASRTRELDGQEGPYWCGDDGVWKDVWISKLPPAAAKVIVYRKGCSRGFVGVAKFSEYAQYYDGGLTDMWARMSANQIAKCAESLALRKAFPAELSGLYSEEEMEQIDEPKQVAPAKQEPKREQKAIEAATLAPAKPSGLAEQFAKEIAGAGTTAELKTVTDCINASLKQLSKADTTYLAPLVLNRKAQLAKAADVASAAAVPDTETFPLDSEAVEDAEATPAAKPMPAAERRTTPAAKPQPEDGVQVAGKAITDAILAQMHELGVNWGQIRDGVEKGAEIAAAAALPKMPVDFRVQQLSAVEATRLHAELKGRVEKKRANAEKRAANKNAKQEAGATA